jgi:hypothetical protein
MKKQPTAQQSIARILANRYSFRMIVDELKNRGITVSIGHLSRINAGERAASQGLTDTLEILGKEWGK